MEQFDSEKFAHTLNTLGTWDSLLSQIDTQQIYIKPDCPYFENFAKKLFDLHVSLMAMNTYYAHAYGTYKEENTNG